MTYSSNTSVPYLESGSATTETTCSILLLYTEGYWKNNFWQHNNQRKFSEFIRLHFS
uniref:Uncharacterized protein n=8 Tax=Bacillota TaxID=1239 RepID=A0A1W7AEV5_ENTFC|nr:Hypothetical protein [Enterococcus faecalis]ARQ19318.1 hypothetical protein [Enterococcus faecium]AMM74552.1 hypothetical protein [Enterococcus faecalis]AMM74574.1 hypothetical protein [Enterococcus faecalis]AMM74584.1 hypothetical protein [Enterococcus faecalis]